MTVSIFMPAHHVCYRRGLGSVQAINIHRSNFPTSLTSARNMCKPERDIDTIRELADGSLMFSFGASHTSGHTRASHPSGNAKRATNFSSSHAEQIKSSKNTLPRRMPSNFRRQSPIPISAGKTGNSIRNPSQQDTGFEMVQDNYDPERVIGKIPNAIHNKRGYWYSQRSLPAHLKGSSISSTKDGDGPGLNKLSDEHDIIDLFKQVYTKKNPANNEKNDQLSKSKFKNREYPSKNVWRQYRKEYLKEDASIRHSSVGDEKVPARTPSSRRGPQKTKYEKVTKVDKSLSEAFLLSRPPSKFIRRSPIPLSAVKQDVRPVPGIQESKISFAEGTLTEQDEGVLKDSDGTSTSVENDYFLRNSLSLSEDKLNDLRELKLKELKKDGGILRDSDGMSTSVENGSVHRDSPKISEDELNDLNELKIVDLKKTAKSYGLKGYSKLKKAELLELLRNAIRQS